MNQRYFRFNDPRCVAHQTVASLESTDAIYCDVEAHTNEITGQGRVIKHMINT
jgi:hypothetical protein